MPTTNVKVLNAATTTGAREWVPTQDNGLATSPGVVGCVQVTLVATGATVSSVTYETSPDQSIANVVYTFTNIGTTPVTIQCGPSPYGRLNYVSGTGTITGYITTMEAPLETGGAHLLSGTGSGAISGVTGTGELVLATSPTLVTPILGVASCTSLATSAATPLIMTSGQAVNIALTAQTVNPTTLTIPDFASVVDEFTFKTKAQTMSNKTFIAPVLGVATGTSFNGLTITNTTGVLTITAAKTLAVAKSLTLDGTDSTTMTFPTTSATIARTDAANTFTGVQTFSSLPVFSAGIRTGAAKLTDGAIAASNSDIFITKGSALGASTLATPTATTHDNWSMTITSTTAFAHVITVTTGKVNGAAATGITFTSAAIGDSVTLKAWQGIWYIVATRGTITLA